jgi:hypothetical protein
MPTSAVATHAATANDKIGKDGDGSKSKPFAIPSAIALSALKGVEGALGGV